MNDGDAAAIGRPTVWLTGAVAIFGAVVASLIVGLRVANDGAEPLHENWWLVAWLVAGVVDAVVGVTLFARPDQRRLGGCLLVGGIVAVVVALATQAVGYSEAMPEDTLWRDIGELRPWGRPIVVGLIAALVPWQIVLGVRARRGVEAVWWASAALIAFTAVGHGIGAQREGADIIDIASWGVALSATCATASVVAVWWSAGRWEAEDPLWGWLAWGTVAAWLGLVPERFDTTDGKFPGSDVVGPLLLLATVPLLVVGILVRALRDRPGRLHGVTHQTVAWVAFSGAVIVIYTGAVAGLGRLVGGSAPTWLLVVATGVIAVVAEPFRRRVGGAVDRLAFGARDDPLQIVRDVVDHVGAQSGVELLPALAVSLQRELRLDRVAIDVRTPSGWDRAALVGPETPHERSVELRQSDDVVGRLVVGWGHGVHLRARDERVLEELTAPLGLAVGWVRLTAQLRRSNMAIVAARAEERRRLRRDFHDGLGPALTGVSLGLRTAVRQLERSPDAASLAVPRELLDRIADEVDALIGEVKRIARDLRPTALDQFGLVIAVSEFTRSFGDELEFHLDLPDPTIELPAAVEAATYRIVSEAVTNVVRHAHASCCWLTISIDDAVDIDVADDGVGIAANTASGIGWTAMRERAFDLGGVWSIESRKPSGARIHVRLPLVVA